MEEKIQTTEWGEILTNRVSDKGHAPRICEELLQLNQKKTTQFLNTLHEQTFLEARCVQALRL